MKGSHQTRRQLAQKLKMLRFTHGWSQEALAEASGLHRTYISNIECGHCNPSLDNLERLALAFGISPSDLLREPEANELLTQWQQWHCKESAAHYSAAGAVILH